MTGEYDGRVYFWASDMIIVETLSKEVIQQTVQSLIEEDELKEEHKRGSSDLLNDTFLYY